MSQPEEDRYEIRERRVAEPLRRRYPNIPAKTYAVWDKVRGRFVPFSNSSSLPKAEERLERIKDRGR